MVQYQEGTGANCRLPLNPPFFGDFNTPYVGTPGSMSAGFGDVRPTSRTCSSAPGRRTCDRRSPTSGTSSWSARSPTRTSLSVGYVGSKSDARGRLPRLQPAAARRRAIRRPGRPASSAAAWLLPASPAPCATPRPTPEATTTACRRACGAVGPTGFEFLASYTFSKALGDNPGFYGPGWGGYSANSPNTGLGGDGNYNSVRHAARLRAALVLGAPQRVRSPEATSCPSARAAPSARDWSGVTAGAAGRLERQRHRDACAAASPAPPPHGWGPGSSLQNSGFSFERPDRVEGADPQTGDSGWDNYLNPAAFKPAALGHLRQLGDRHLVGTRLLERRPQHRQELPARRHRST